MPAGNLVASISATYEAGLFASPIVFGLFSWPFLVVWVLWASARKGQARIMSIVGLVLSAVALLGCSGGLNWREIFSLALESCVPVLLFTLQGAHPEHEGRVWGGMGTYLPFLVVGCVLMGSLLHARLAVLFFDGAGTVMLAWWDSRATRRAMPAWEMVRLRLSGVVLASLGVAVSHGGALFPSLEGAQTIGQVLAIAGLCMTAGLGSTLSSVAELDLLDIGLRFVPLMMLLTMAVTPFARLLMMCAGLLSLFVTMLGWRGRLPLLPCLTSLGLLAAATGQMVALLLLYAVSVLAISVRFGYPSSSRGDGVTLSVQLVLPVVIVVLLALGREMNWVELSVVLLCMMLGLRRLDMAALPDDLLLLWRRGGWMMRLIIGFFGVLSVFALCWLVKMHIYIDALPQGGSVS